MNPTTPTGTDLQWKQLRFRGETQMTDRESDANVIDPPENAKADAEPDAQTADAAAIDPPENTGGGN